MDCISVGDDPAKVEGVCREQPRAGLASPASCMHCAATGTADTAQSPEEDGVIEQQEKYTGPSIRSEDPEIFPWNLRQQRAAGAMTRAIMNWLLRH